MRPRFTEAILLIDTDVTKLSSDDKTRAELQRSIEAFLLRGGGLVGTHDVIYRRTRNESLERAFGGKITNFLRTSEPIEYVKSSAHKDHPIALHMPDRFSLHDGELLWGTWADDTETIFETPAPDPKSLVVTRSYGIKGGRLVWLHSCDHRESAAASLSVPEHNLVDLITASLNWVSQRKWRPANYPFVVAHRGLHGVEHENTLGAFEAACTHGIDYAECDIRVTLDGECVIHHDDTIDGTLLSEMNLLEATKLAKQLNYELLTFSTLLHSMKGRLKLDVELKEEGSEAAVLAMLKIFEWPEEDFVITSFHDASLRKVKLTNSNIRCGLLLGKDRPKRLIRTRISELFPVSRLKACRADFAAPNHQLVRLGFARRVSGAGFPIWVWTVNERSRMQSLMNKQGVEALITDVTDIVSEERLSLHKKLAERGGYHVEQ